MCKGPVVGRSVERSRNWQTIAWLEHSESGAVGERRDTQQVLKNS